MTAERRTLRIEECEQLVHEREGGRMPAYSLAELLDLICGADWATPEERERAQRLVARLEPLQPGCQGSRWTADELAVLGTMPDKEVAAKIGKSEDAVRLQRRRRQIPPSA
jgi:hypothetical protein